MSDDEVLTLQNAYDGPVIELNNDQQHSVLEIRIADGSEVLRVAADGRIFVRGEEVTHQTNEELGKAIAQVFFMTQAANEVPSMVWGRLCAPCTAKVHEGLREEAMHRLGAKDG